MGRASKKIKIRGKPTPKGFKQWVLANAGYFVTWVWHSKELGPHCSQYEGLNPTQSVVAHLVEQLPQCHLGYHLWLDNLFISVALCTYLHARNIGCSGTARVNSGIYKDLVKLKKHPPADLTWGQMFTRVNQSKAALGLAWVNHGPVLFQTNTSDPESQVK